MISVFQGSDDLRKVVSESLGLSTDWEDRFDYTYPIYHTAFFYLQKRFGVSENYDEDKESGHWVLEFKNVRFCFRFHSDSLEIWVLGNGRDHISYNTFPNQRAYNRVLRRHSFVELYPFENMKIGELTKEEVDLHHEEVLKFFGSKNPPSDIVEEKIDEWLNYVYSFNYNKRMELYKKHSRYTTEQYIEFEKKYGRCKSHHKYLLKILRKLLKCFMREPVWVRDVPFNIKGRMNGREIKDTKTEIKLISK